MSAAHVVINVIRLCGRCLQIALSFKQVLRVLSSTEG
jgi:hypothetical protein